MKTNKKLQRFIQIILLGLFIVLVASGKPQIWMGLFILGLVGSFIFGRFYCGWICAINTVMVGISSIKKKMGIKDRPMPAWMMKPVTRYLALGLFIVTFIFTIRTGVKLPVLPAMVLLGALLTLIYSEELWHKYLCPYGTILHASSARSKKGLEVNTEACISCGICMKVCPAGAVSKDEKSYKISQEDCLICMECLRDCPTKAIDYI